MTAALLIRILVVSAIIYVMTHANPLHAGDVRRHPFQSTQTAAAVSYGPLMVLPGRDARGRDIEYHRELLRRKDITDQHREEALAFIRDCDNIR